MDKKNALKNYEIPQIEIIEIEVEGALLDSNNTEGFGEWE